MYNPLVEVQFKDKTSYTTQVGSDVGGIVIDHFWGPAYQIVTCDYLKFLELFPPSKSVKLTDSYVTAIRAYQSGMQTCEVVRYQNYKQAFFSLATISETTTLKTDYKSLAGGGYFSLSDFGFALKYPGIPPELLGYENFYVKVEVISNNNTIISGFNDLKITLQDSQGSQDSQATQGSQPTVFETITGSTSLNATIDGQNYFIGYLLNNSKYFTAVNLSDNISVSSEISFEVKVESLKDSTSRSESSLYKKFLMNTETSRASILIDYGVPDDGKSNLYPPYDRVAILGTPSSFELSSFKPAPALNVAVYHCRELCTLYGRTYRLNGIGTIVGRYCAVANDESVNQLPSAKTWGTFPGTLASTLSWDEVVTLQNAGINSVYNASSGPTIFGVRSLYARSTSYYSKFNIGRTCARILKYAYQVAYDCIHTGNTTAKKQLVQNLLTADMQRLIAQGALRSESSVLCDSTNNADIDTNGGEILFVDYTCYFVKLIEKVTFRITATDTSVSVQTT